MKKNMTPKKFVYSSLYLALFIYPFMSINAYAETTPKKVATPTQLADVKIVGKKKKVNRKDNEITGLGKIVKNTKDIDSEQVLNIRDLVRYDPGVAVVEQGRGASAGYSIRGVDKNRVALVVDGIPQAQSYVMQGENMRARHGGGSINEVENENIAAIEISKGASSAEYGSGSLGGAIGFRTKEPNDIIADGKDWGVTTKSAYSSKNKQLTNSIGLAGRTGGFEAMVQYTNKDGESTQIHDDAIDTVDYKIKRLGHYLNEFDFRGEPNQKSNAWFIIEDDCPSGNCEPKSKASITDEYFRYGESPTRNGEFTPEEKDAIAKIPHIEETVSSKDYTGNNRVIPDPMDYKTNSLLAKLGYQFNNNHYLGGVYEDTKQRYDIRDMTTKSYYGVDEKTAFQKSQGIYGKDGSPLDGLWISTNIEEPRNIGLRWSRAQFFDENHEKERKGLVYRYEGDKDSWVDNAKFTWDNQDIILDTQIHNPHCAEYPNVDKNCRPSVDKPWSYYASERNTYSESHDLFKLSLDKTFNVLSTKHKVNGVIGYDDFESNLDRSDYYQQYSIIDYENLGGNGSFDNPYRYKVKDRKVVTEQLCNDYLSAFRDCRTRTITGNNKFAAISDQIKVNKYLDIGLGGRIDEHKFESEDPWTSVKNHNTSSWNAGVVVKPNKNIALSYRASSGFRVPSFQEMFGYRVPGLTRELDGAAYKPSKLEPEKSLNKEFGIGIKGNFGVLEMSYFKNDYEDLITLAKEKPKEVGEINFSQYSNAQSMKVKGYNVVGTIDWNGISDKLPEGLTSTIAYNRIKPTEVVNDPKYVAVRSYAFDALQPARYIFGLGYNQPEDKWGLKAIMTYSKAKDPSELDHFTVANNGETYRESNTNRTTRSWHTIDLVGHLNPTKNVTLRAGVYNLMDYRYVTWESVRQSTNGSINQHHDVDNYTRYAAPGRNFVLSLETKF